jgi:uncharacterized lipoprotein YmbA
MTRPLALTLTSALLLGGCAGNGPPPVLLTLPAGPAVSTAAPPTPAVARGTLVVRRVAIPEYLQTRRVRYRADASTLQEWPQVSWAERLEVGVTRELAAALRRALPDWTICEGSCPDGQAQLSLQLDLRPLDLVRAEAALHASARWSLSQTSAAALSVPEQFDARIPVKADSPQGHAEAISAFLQALATKVAKRAGAPG